MIALPVIDAPTRSAPLAIALVLLARLDDPKSGSSISLVWRAPGWFGVVTASEQRFFKSLDAAQQRYDLACSRLLGAP